MGSFKIKHSATKLEVCYTTKQIARMPVFLVLKCLKDDFMNKMRYKKLTSVGGDIPMLLLHC